MDARAAESLLVFAEQSGQDMKSACGNMVLQQIEQRYDELQAAVQWFIDQRQANESLRLANALYAFWITKQRFEDGAVWFDRVLALPAGDESLRGTAFIGAGFMAYWKGADAQASAAYTSALEIARRLGDQSMVSRALGGLSRVALRSDVAEGRKLAAEALTISESARDNAGRSNAMHLLGVGAQIAGDLIEAREWMSKRLALVREMKNEALISSEASNLSMVERQLGNLDAAERLVREALEIAERRGDEFMKPFALSGLAAIARDRRQFDRAATLVGAAETMMETRDAAWPPDERPHYERTVSDLTTAMGPAAFGKRREAGRAMSSSSAVRFALEKSDVKVGEVIAAPEFRQLLQYERGNDTRTYSVRVVPEGAELWAVTEAPGKVPRSVKEGLFTSADQALDFLDEVRRTLVAGGWREL
jgi:non-specific serine/threonine protein kinase